jgi:DNA-binding transcriptional LysR family regulator
MEWQQITSFLQVVRLGSFTKAAEAVFRTQSALSQQIKGLEDELGCLLIERIGKRKLRITSAGERFFQFAERVLQEYEFLRESLDDLQGVHKRALRVAAPFTTLYHLFPEILQRYLAEFPQVQVTILDRPQKAVIELVKNGDVDFGFVLESAAPWDLFVSRARKVETVLITPSGHPLTALELVTFKEIAEYPLILNPAASPHSGHLNIQERLKRLGLTYRVIMESSNVELNSLYVELGLGITFATVTPNLPILKQRKLAFIPLDHIFDPDHIAVIARKNSALAAHKNAFLNIALND